MIGLLKSHYDIDTNSPWSEGITQLLGLMKILPAKAVGKKLAQIENAFKKAEQKLIVFRKV